MLFSLIGLFSIRTFLLFYRVHIAAADAVVGEDAASWAESSVGLVYLQRGQGDVGVLKVVHQRGLSVFHHKEWLFVGRNLGD